MFLGLAATAFVLYRFHVGTYGLNDVFGIIAENQKAELIENEDLSEEKNELSAVIIDPNSEQEKLEDFLRKSSDGKKFENVIILAENPSWRGNNSAVTLREFEDFQIFKELKEKAEENEVKISFSKVDDYENLLSISSDVFEGAEVIPLFIQDIATDEEMQNLAEALAQLDSGTLLIAALPFSENLPAEVMRFHDELSQITIETLDSSAISQLDIGNRPILYFLFRYLEKAEAGKVEIVDHEVRSNSSGFFVKFSKGKKPEESRNLTMMAFGDVMLSRHVRTLMNKNGLAYPFENIEGYQKRFFEGADIVFANLEGPIKGKGTSGGTAMVFSFNEDSAPLLKSYGFNVLSLANNHALDQGTSGRDTTIAALEASGLGWCGHPSEEDFNSVHYGMVGDKKYAIICFQDITAKINDEDAINLIKAVRPNVDYLIVTPHWGYEYKPKADYGTQIEPGHAWIDAGADIIIGHHPHVVQNFETYNGKFIFYSLGNFIFDQYWSMETQKMLSLGIILDDSGDTIKSKVYLFPLKSEMARPRLMTEEERTSWFEGFIEAGDYSEELKTQIRNGLIEAQ